MMTQIRLSCLVLLALVAISSADQCSESVALTCHENAYCEDEVCFCQEGYIDDSAGAAGTSCVDKGYRIRQVYYCASSFPDDSYDNLMNNVKVSGAASVFVKKDEDTKLLEVSQIYATDPVDADVTAVNSHTIAGCVVQNSGFDAGVYTWQVPSSSAPLEILPTGLEVTSVAYASTCSVARGSQAGCWVIDVLFTAGDPDSDFSTIYFPRINSTDAGSYDETPTPTEAATLLDSNFPVANEGAVGELAAFLTDYRVTTEFKAYAESIAGSERIDETTVGTVNGANGRFFGTATDAVFDGLLNSPGITSVTLLDPFFFQYEATIEIEEVDMRSLAGQRRGTAGVEYTVDSFVGFVNMVPTPESKAIDTMASQAAIHLEKTNFFSVSTHGTNEYTFLEYVNLRLVQVYVEDPTQASDMSTNAELQTSSAGNFVYVQVTFTLGDDKYQPNDNGEGLIPLDSVRTSRGTFYSDVESSMDHSCLDWDPTDGDSDYVDLLAQDCGPKTTMCVKQTATIPDQFVVFNIPLGEEYLDGWYTDDTSQNVFVSLVIDAIDVDTIAAGNDPNDGDAAEQMKTTLTASIPIVEGGVNIFCDGITAKTDLSDVMKAHLVIGSASSSSELSRLTIFEDIANTERQAGEVPEIDTDSIQSGLMTLVVVGDDDYFANGYGVEVEDVITVHTMQTVAPTGSEVAILDQVTTLLTNTGTGTSGILDDNADTNGNLDTDGYALNDAFWFWVDRATNRAHLEPSTALTGLCPFNPVRPTTYSCVTRRDIRFRGFPNRVGGASTAIEISITGDNAGTSTSDHYEDEKAFMASVLGDSNFAVDLGVAFADVIHIKYLTGGGADRYKRAYWINPSYEWTPSQTGGQSLFTLSQGIVMYALVVLNENAGNTPVSTSPIDTSPDAVNIPAPTSLGTTRRRALLQADVAQNPVGEEATSGNSMVVKMATDAEKVLLQAMGDGIKEYATFEAVVRLTEAEACMDKDALIEELLKNLERSVVHPAVSSASAVQLLSVGTVDKGDVTCPQRRLRNLLALSTASVPVTVAVGFDDETNMELDLAALAASDEALSGLKAVHVPETVDTNSESEDEDNEGEDSKDVKTDDKTEESAASSVFPSVLAILFAFASLVVM